MEELQTVLNNILADKNANLKPENLKKGVTCLGVTGTLETSTTPEDEANSGIIE